MLPLVAGYALACAGLHVAVRGRCPKCPFGALRLPNLVVAASHAAFLFLLAFCRLAPRVRLTALTLYPIALENLLPLQPSADVAAMQYPEALAASALLGYLLYDTCAVAAGHASGGVALMLHHGLGGALWGAMLTRRCGGVYISWVHLAEGSTPFLHACTAMHKLGGWEGSRTFTACAAALLGTFFLFRAVSAPLCFASVLRHRAAWPSQPLWAFAAAVSAFFVGLNWFWFGKLLQRAVGGPKVKAD